MLPHGLWFLISPPACPAFSESSWGLPLSSSQNSVCSEVLPILLSSYWPYSVLLKQSQWHSAIKSLPIAAPSHIHLPCIVSSFLLLEMILGSLWQSLPQPLDCTPSTCPLMSLLDTTLPMGHYPCTQNQHPAKQQNDYPCSLFSLQKNPRGSPLASSTSPSLPSCLGSRSIRALFSLLHWQRSCQSYYHNFRLLSLKQGAWDWVALGLTLRQETGDFQRG